MSHPTSELARRDPDAKLRHKPGHRTHLVHRGQVAVDPEARVIVALRADGADRARCRGTRLLQLQLLAAATAINLKRLLKADTATAAEQTGDPAVDTAAVTPLLRLLAASSTRSTTSPRPIVHRAPGAREAQTPGWPAKASPTPRSVRDCSSVPRPPHAA
jgi:hypothetical protein